MATEQYKDGRSTTGTPSSVPRKPASSRRAEINLGYACNNRCLFCSEQEHRSDLKTAGMDQTEALKRQITDLYQAGARHLTFLGGEPTIRRDFIDLVHWANCTGFDPVLLTTNGRMLANRTYAEALSKAGLTHLVLSLHGPTAAIHDGTVQVQGAFTQLRKALANLQELAIPFSLTSVISTMNLKELPQLAEFQASWKPRRVYWAFVRPIGGGRERFDQLVPTFEALDGPLRVALDLARETGIPWTVGHIPLCRMQGYEAHVDELYWEEGSVDRRVQRKSDNPDNATGLQATWVTKGHHKVKHPGCMDCRYEPVCEGVHEEYVRRRGFAEFRPVAGSRIDHPDRLREARFMDESKA